MTTGSKRHALVVGGGAIGQALVARLSADSSVGRVTQFARGLSALSDKQRATGPIELLDESSIERAAKFARDIAPVDILIVATGILHDLKSMQPEKRLAELTTNNALTLFHINALGPALIAKHMLALLSRDRRNVFAALSARVGSIDDNRLGGWYSYRASKAALNMFLKCAAIEQARQNKHSIVVGLHPGTVNSRLSQPFQRNVPEGGLFDPDRAATQLLAVIEALDVGDSGKLFAWDGRQIPS